MLSGLPLMVQAAFLDCLFIDAFSPFLDGGIAPEVDVFKLRQIDVLVGQADI